MKRKPFIAGNWKMNLDRKSAVQLARSVAELAGKLGSNVDVALFPPSVYLAEVVSAVKGNAARVGAQNFYFAEKGAFTGEISASMIRDCGATLALIGHSERRHVFGESDDWIAKKVRAALQFELEPVLCVGEKLEEREAGKTMSVIERQLRSALEGLNESQLKKITIAYEPVWAIGTGKTATPAQASEVHRQIRSYLSSLCGAAFAEAVRIQYGGSVTADNAAELIAEPGIDGFLVGGASLEISKFQKIVESGLSKATTKS